MPGSPASCAARPESASPRRTAQKSARQPRPPVVQNVPGSPTLGTAFLPTPSGGLRQLPSSIDGSAFLASPDDQLLLASFNIRHFTKAKLSGVSRSPKKKQPGSPLSQKTKQSGSQSRTFIDADGNLHGSEVSVAETLVKILSRFSITCIQEGRDTGRTTYMPHPEPVVERSYCPLMPAQGASAGNDPAKFVPTCALSQSLVQRLPAGKFAAAASEGLGDAYGGDGSDGRNGRGKSSYRERYLFVWRDDIWKLVGAWEETQPQSPRSPRGARRGNTAGVAGTVHSVTRMARNPFVGHFVHRQVGVHVVVVTVHIKPSAAVAELQVLSNIMDDLKSRLEAAANQGVPPSLKDLRRRPLPPVPSQPSVHHADPSRPAAKTTRNRFTKHRWKALLRGLFRRLSSCCGPCIHGDDEISLRPGDEESQLGTLSVRLEALSLNGTGSPRVRRTDQRARRNRPAVVGPVLLGDLNAGRAYLPKSARKHIPLFSDASKYYVCIGDDVDTTAAAGTNEAYDRIIVPADQVSLFGQGFAVRFDDIVVKTGEGPVLQKDVLKISDHYPVAVKLNI